MVYAHSWEGFAREAKIMVRAEPNKVRFCTRWSHKRGCLVLKVTDDSECLKLKCRSSIILNRFELLVREAARIMQAKPLIKEATAAATTTTTSSTAAANKVANSESAAAVSSKGGAGSGSGGPTTSSGKGGKKGKKKK